MKNEPNILVMTEILCAICHELIAYQQESVKEEKTVSVKLCSIGLWLQVVSVSWELPEWTGKIMKTYYQYRDWCKSKDRRPFCKTKFIGKLADKYNIEERTDPVHKKVLYIADVDQFKMSIGWDGLEKN